MKSMAIPPKKELRKEARKKRDLIAAEQRKLRSERIADALFSLESWEEAERVFVYASFGSEVSTEEIICRCHKERKEVLFPRMEGEEIAFYPVKEGDALLLHPYGILEPEGKGVSYLAGKKDLVLVPGLLFSEQGYRLGYGGGFYDRFLAKCPECVAAGLAFEAQISDEIPVEDWDQPLSLIVTEDRILNLTNRS